MITKTYLEGKLRSLEERLERRIDIKDDRIFREMETDIAELKNNAKLLEEKLDENRDVIEGCFEEQNNMKQELKKLKLKIDGAEKETDIELNGSKNNEITSDF